MKHLISLTTDFQTGSPYIAQMKGVLCRLVPDIQLVDVTHSVPPQNILFGAFALADTVPYFPPGTVHIAVVDPGVGTARELLCVRLGRNESDAQTILCPNNGLLTELVGKLPVLSVNLVNNPDFFLPNPSATFHGRDILSPVAAALCLGTPVSAFGPSLPPEKLCRLTVPQPRHTPHGWTGRILFADSFGNLTTNLTREQIPAPAWLQCENLRFPFVRTYADACPGSLVALFGSQGRLELAIVNGNARDVTRLEAGNEVFAEYPS